MSSYKLACEQGVGMMRSARWMLLVPLLWSPVMVIGAPVAAEQAPTVAVSEQAAPVDERAMEHLMKMARFLGQTKQFSMDMKATYEVLQDDGVKLEFSEKRRIDVQRPGRLRSLETAGSNGNVSLYLDGKNMTVYDDASKLYAQGPQPGPIDASVMYFVRDLKIRFPLAPLLMQQFPDVLKSRVKAAEYIERTSYFGTPAHHILARNDEVDMQIWIADGKNPVPLRVVLTYRNAPGQPQFRADLSNWNLAPKLAPGMFTLARPAGAKQISFSEHLEAVQSVLEQRGSTAEGNTK